MRGERLEVRGDDLFVGGYIGGNFDNPSVTSVTKSVAPSAATATYL